MCNIYDKPLLSERTKRLVQNSGRHRLPLHSPDRYELEIQSYRLKKESY